LLIACSRPTQSQVTGKRTVLTYNTAACDEKYAHLLFSRLNLVKLSTVDVTAKGKGKKPAKTTSASNDQTWDEHWKTAASSAHPVGPTWPHNSIQLKGFAGLPASELRFYSIAPIFSSLKTDIAFPNFKQAFVAQHLYAVVPPGTDLIESETTERVREALEALRLPYWHVASGSKCLDDVLQESALAKALIEIDRHFEQGALMIGTRGCSSSARGDRQDCRSDRHYQRLLLCHH
jgi:hypothetical protein